MEGFHYLARPCLSTLNALHLPSATHAQPEVALSVSSFPSAEACAPPCVWIVKSDCLSLTPVDFLFQGSFAVSAVGRLLSPPVACVVHYLLSTAIHYLMIVLTCIVPCSWACGAGSQRAAWCCLSVSMPHGAEPGTGTHGCSQCLPKTSPNSEISRKLKDMHNACTWKMYVGDPCHFCSYFIDQRPVCCQGGGEIDSF